MSVRVWPCSSSPGGSGLSTGRPPSKPRPSSNSSAVGPSPRSTTRPSSSTVAVWWARPAASAAPPWGDSMKPAGSMSSVVLLRTVPARSVKPPAISSFPVERSVWVWPQRGWRRRSGLPLSARGRLVKACVVGSQTSSSDTTSVLLRPPETSTRPSGSTEAASPARARPIAVSEVARCATGSNSSTADEGPELWTPPTSSTSPSTSTTAAAPRRARLSGRRASICP